MDRRQFVAASGAAAAFSILPSTAFAQGSGDAAINVLFEKIFQESLQNSPELASSLGLDKGPNAALKSKLGANTAAERMGDLARNRRAIAALQKIAPGTLSAAAQLNREVVLYLLETRTIPAARFGIDSVQRPYRLFQQGGAYFETPDFLNTAHTINTTADCDAYLARLSAFATALDEDSAEQRAQAARGYLAPAWSIDLTLGQMAKLRAPVARASGMVQSLASRAAAKNIAGDWAARAEKIVAGSVYPALDRQIALMTALRAKTVAGDGAWRLKDGAAVYAAALEAATTTKFTPEQVHQIGLEQVADLTAKLDVILKAAGMTQGTVGARLAALNVRREQLFANTDPDRAALIESLNVGVKAMYARLPQAFSTLPTQPLEIRRVPPEIQDGASNGYYRSAALDGSRPAIYFINLKDTGDWPKYSLPSLTFHEGVPGHHLQISLAQESKDIPTLRKIGGFSAYSEGRGRGTLARTGGDGRGIGLSVSKPVRSRALTRWR